jgi:Type II restriction endonuclease EcoO109I
MTELERIEILEKYKIWFKDILIVAHKKNSEKLVDIDEFAINPFTIFYLAKFFKGDTSPRSVAEVLLYPRILGTSISTSFGQHIQKFISQLSGVFGSTTSGIDIEFIDQIDNRKKYCQLKSGPNVINSGDVKSIDDDFASVRNLAKANHITLQYGDLVFALTYGEPKEINSFILELQKRDISVYVGKEFWARFTGEPNFYEMLIAKSVEVVEENRIFINLDNIVDKLSGKVKLKYFEYYKQDERKAKHL